MLSVSIAARSYSMWQNEVGRIGKKIRMKEPEAFVRFQKASEEEEVATKL